MDGLDVLRQRNKDLLDQLKRLSGCSQSRKRDREDEAEESREPAQLLRTLTDGDRGAGRAALARPTVRFAGNETVCLHEANNARSGCANPPICLHLCCLPLH